jgi:hypothetical protein
MESELGPTRLKIPANITREHVILAINELDQQGIPKKHKSTKFDLIYNDRPYPPKYVISMANIFANGEPFDTVLFSGGEEANNYLEKLGFEIELKSNVWIFQANPDIYDILAEINNPDYIDGTWLVSRYQKEIKNGDIGLIWKSGDNPGIYAIIDIISDPEILIDDDETYWKDKEEARTPHLRVNYRYSLKFEVPLFEEEIKTIDGLKDLSILHFHQATNFRVTLDEWKILSDIFRERYGYLLDESEKAYSWTTINSDVAVKKMDRSSFIHHGTVIPNKDKVRSFFDLFDIKQGYRRHINLIFQEKSYEAVISADIQTNPRTRLIWHEDFASVIRSNMPSWHQYFSSNYDALQDSPEMRFIKTGRLNEFKQPNEFKIEFIEPKLALDSVNYWWVNQNQTYKEEIGGGYLWSPQTKKNGRKNASYDFMKEVKPGDIIFSFCNTKIQAIGICIHPAIESEKPTEFENIESNWSKNGWKIDVKYGELSEGFRPKDYINILRPFIPEKYSPLNIHGDGQQSIYLTKLPNNLANTLIEIMGNPYHDTIERLTRTFQIINDDEKAEKDLNTDISIPDTVKEQLQKARIGQGKFRSELEKIETNCRVTGIDISEHLVASHIKPWAKSTNQQRLDGNNGLLFSPHIHHLFDKGYLGFNQSGDLLISPKLSPSIIDSWKIPNHKNVGKFTPKQLQYLKFHEDIIFLSR